MRSLPKTIFLFATIFSVVYAISSAQFFGPSGELSGGEEDEVNVFLEAAAPANTSSKSPAQQFNGTRSGIYSGQKLSCPYAFERDLYLGLEGEDVRLLQVLLNSDRRTIIAESGSGSPGQESDKFGQATVEALKRFQTLFLEYVGISNGRFGPRTRTLMNAICNGENTPTTSPDLVARQNKNIYENIFSVQRDAVPGGVVSLGVNDDRVTPRVSLSSNVSTILVNENFKVFLNTSEEIVPVTLESVIIDGGIVKEIRKLSATAYLVVVAADQSSKKVFVQVEAEKLEDLAGNKNENASNEVVVNVTTTLSSSGSTVKDVDFNTILDKIIASAPKCTYNSSGILNKVGADGKEINTTGCAPTQNNFQTYNCNGRQILVTQSCKQSLQTVCTTQINPSTGQPQEVCKQLTEQQAKSAQQAEAGQQFGQVLGSLLRSFGVGTRQQTNQPSQQQFPSITPNTPSINPTPNPFPGIPVSPSVKLDEPKATPLTNEKIITEKLDKIIKEQESLGKIDKEAGDYCNIPGNRATLEKTNASDKVTSTCEVEFKKGLANIDRVKERNVACTDTRELYCDKNICYSLARYDLLVMVRPNKEEYIIRQEKRAGVPNRLEAKVGECIIQNPIFTPSHYSNISIFDGCYSTSARPTDLPKASMPSRKKINQIYNYSFSAPLRGVPCL